MDYRKLGSSDLSVPVLSLGTGTFGGSGPLFGAWGNSGPAEARRFVDICLAAGANMFDTADSYSQGAAEMVLGEAIRGRRNSAIICTKTGLSTANEVTAPGKPRERLIAAVNASLARLGTDYLDLLQLHALDVRIPLEETHLAMEKLVSTGKVRHVGVSNYPGWQLMKALGTSEAENWPRFVSHQVYYSLIDRTYEAELMPLAADQDVGALVWSPLGWGRLTGKVRRGAPLPATSRLHETAGFAPPVEEEHLYRVIDVLERVAAETGKAVPQVALNWLLDRPTIASVIIGARSEEQLHQNLGAVGWSLTDMQRRALDEASAYVPGYPHWLYQREPFVRMNPPIT